MSNSLVRSEGWGIRGEYVFISFVLFKPNKPKVKNLKLKEEKKQRCREARYRHLQMGVELLNLCSCVEQLAQSSTGLSGPESCCISQRSYICMSGDGVY